MGLAFFTLSLHAPKGQERADRSEEHPQEVERIGGHSPEETESEWVPGERKRFQGNENETRNRDFVEHEPTELDFG